MVLRVGGRHCTRPFSHISLGNVLIDEWALAVLVEYNKVANRGVGAGKLGVKIKLSQQRQLATDIVWAGYTPRSHDPDLAAAMAGMDPGVYADRVGELTGFRFKTLGFGRTVVLSPGKRVAEPYIPVAQIFIPGPKQGAEVESLWRDASEVRFGVDGITFKVESWLYELNDLNQVVLRDGPDGSIEYHEFPEAFRALAP